MEAFFLKLAGSAGGTGIAALALYVVYKVVMWRRSNGPKVEPEVSGVTSLDHLPVTAGQCKSIHAVNDEKFETIKSSLAETGNRIEKIDTKIDGMRDSQTDALSEMRTAVAVLKDRTNRRD